VLQIQQATDKLLQPLGMSAGAAANYGEVITGEIGSSGRCEFTAIGEPVNLASRVEKFNAVFGTRFLATAAFVDNLHWRGCTVIAAGDHEVKGLDKPVAVFEIRPGQS
jgi:adenylate cyclase